LAFEVTGRIQVGRFVLEIGHPAGTRADIAPEPGGANPAPLALALDQPEPADALTHAEAAVEDAASVTGRVERALELFTAVAQGRVDRQVVLKEVDVLIGALERADREGRYADVIRLSRALAALLALLMRWVALVQALRLALKAAQALADPANAAGRTTSSARFHSEPRTPQPPTTTSRALCASASRSATRPGRR